MLQLLWLSEILIIKHSIKINLMIELRQDITFEEIYRQKISTIKKNISDLEAKISSKFHIWWAKKPGNIIAQLIQFFSQPDDIILDPFSGSGTVLEETIKLNRRCISVDINPLSIFIMKNLISKKNWKKIEYNYDKIMEKLKNTPYFIGFNSIFEFYQSNCPECNQLSRLHYMVWHNDLPSLIRLECKTHGIFTKEVIDASDFNIMKRIENLEYNSKVNNFKFLKNSRINISKDMYLSDIFTKRNFIALSIFLENIQSLENSAEKDFLKFIFSSTLRKTSNLIGTKGGLSLGFWIPKNNRKENNVFLQLEKTKNKIFKQIEYLNFLSNHNGIAKNYLELKSGKSVLLKKYNAEKLEEIIEKESVDLIITDPPYADEVPYLELSQLWNSFLNFPISNNDYDDEIILTNSPERLNKKAGTQEGLNSYFLGLKKTFAQMYQVLKTDHFACIWFHEAELKIWNFLIQAALEAGFHYLDQINVNTSVRSLKPKFSPKHSLTGHVLIFLVKLGKKPDLREKPEWNEIEKIIFEQGKKIIKGNGGGASTSDLYNGLGDKEEGIIAKLIKNNALIEVSKKYDNLFSLFKKYFEFNKENQVWVLR